MRALEFGPLEEIIEKYGNLRQHGAAPEYAPCRLACPAEVHAEGYVTLLSEGMPKEAIDLFRENNPFAGVLGRVCTHPCESECQRGKVDHPVAIRSLKRYMADYELNSGRPKAVPATITKKEAIAIIGSGPAGLSCAYDLIRKGYPVTIFEAAPKSGGMMRYGIPEYRLPKEILLNEISYLEELGVKIKTNSPIKKLDDLFGQKFKAIFLATGAWTSQKLDMPGEDAEGIIYAIDFLRQVNSGGKIDIGKRVVVIGGGSVAIDSARTASRIGAKEVHLVCLESRDLTCRDRMLAQDIEIQDAEREGVIIHSCLGLLSLLNPNGKVTGLETKTCIAVLNDEGRFAPQFSEDPAPVLATDTIIIAIGQVPDRDSFNELEKTQSGNIKSDTFTLETSSKGVFAGADVVTGPADIISAVAHGKQAATSIERYLKGEDLRQDRRPPVESIALKMGAVSARPQVSSTEERKGFTEIEKGFSKETATEQAARCFRCGSTMPCVIFKSVDTKIPVISWDPIKALELWQKRQPHDGEPLPDIFDEISEVTETAESIIGRNKLVLKAENSEELLYYTTDNE
jgi:heterodisulfide reductase subunit A